MQITIDSTLQADRKLSEAVAERNELLTSIFDVSAAAVWRAGKNWKGQPAVLLSVQDPSGAQSGADFLPVEFKNAQQLEARFRDLKEALHKVHHWREALRRFFTKVRSWCENLPGHPMVWEQPIQVTEGPSGAYEVHELKVDSPRTSAEVFIRPVAAWVVGWDGRVDMIGPGDRYTFHYSQVKDSWYFIPNDAPYQELPFTEQVFSKLIEACFDD